MTAPATPGTYYYKVWGVKGPASSSGQAKAATYSITVPATVPTAALTSLSPTSGPVGATLTITGANMGASGAVTVGGITAATSAWSATSITCTIPAGLTIGAKNVVVAPSGSAASNTLSFTVTVPPAPTAALTSLTPSHALTGASVVIAGTNLGSGGTVRFGSAAATTTAWSATSVTAVVPAGLSAGATSVTATPTGAATSNALAFTVDAPQAPTDTTAPTTTAGGVPAGGWSSALVTVTLAATDNAGGSGVATITYAVDGGTPVVVGASSALVDLGAHFGGDVSAAQGVHTIAYYVTDAAGNAEAPQALTVGHDSIRPSTRAPRAARVRRHHTAALKYKVRDARPNAGTATVVITIKNRAGKVVKRLHLGTRPVNTLLTARFNCVLRAGTYRFSVQATNAAGNRQIKRASQKLTVRPAHGAQPAPQHPHRAERPA